MINYSELYCPCQLQFDTFSIALERQDNLIDTMVQVIKVESQFLKLTIIFTLMRLSRYQLCPLNIQVQYIYINFYSHIAMIFNSHNYHQ